MTRYLAHRVSIDGVDRTPVSASLCLVTVGDDGHITVEAWNGVECHSTVFVNGCLQLNTEIGEQTKDATYADGVKAEQEN